MSEAAGSNGGGFPDWEAQDAQLALGTFMIELLRALARGDDDTRRVTAALIDFTQHASKAEMPAADMVQLVIERLHGMALDKEGERDELEAATKDILGHAIRVAAESMSADNAARGRTAKRLDALNLAIERLVQEREERSRKHGWSYVENLTKHLDKPPSSLRSRRR